MVRGGGGMVIFSYHICLCFGTPPYFIGTYHTLIFPSDVNNLISLLIRHFRIITWENRKIKVFI